MIALISLLLLIGLQASSPVDAKKCPELYRRYSAQHTFCLSANNTCSILKRGVTDKDKKLIVKLHNDYRSKVATGQESHAGGMPKAANMLEMIWDDELASVAQKLAETCNYGHDCNNCRRVKAFSVGQNIGNVNGMGSPFQMLIGSNS
uniref:U12-Sparatoxin-Hju1h_1 n=1 Tax=Heteropoda jugulans TaxID=1358901 RepID=A0A4Q8KD14_9ARAC